MTVIQGLRLATINLPVTFEVSTPAHYDDMKTDIQFGKWGGLGYIWVTQGH